MNHYTFTWLILIALTVLGTGVNANEIHQYKIILASYPKIEEAKSKMEILGSTLTEEDWAAQKKYGYHIVARPSGELFIIAIEPLETKESVERVLKRFQQFYPDAYSSDYFGYTKGALFLSRTSTKKIIPTKSDTPIEKTITKVNSTEKLMQIGGWILLGLGAVAIGALINRIRKLQEKETEPFDLNPKVENPDIQETESMMDAKEDFFHTLKTNKFFLLLLDELKTASDEREIEQCHNLVQEMRRYEKKLHPSRIITEMSELIDAKQFSQLSKFIAQKRGEN